MSTTVQGDIAGLRRRIEELMKLVVDLQRRVGQLEAERQPVDVVSDLVVSGAAEPIKIEDVLDPNFTGGLEPPEYLDKLRKGEL